jgi:hypothetical protein
MSAGSLGERRGRRHGAVARSLTGGGYETYCPQCGLTLSIWPTALEAVLAAASHNCRPHADPDRDPDTEARGSFEWATWFATHMDDR